MRKKASIGTSSRRGGLAQSSPAPTYHHDEGCFQQVIKLIDRSIKEGVRLNGPFVFETAAVGLFSDYLDTFGDPVIRQYFNCRECRKFLNRFGGLVTINPKGVTKSLFFDFLAANAPALYAPAISRMQARIKNAEVIGVFNTNEMSFGSRETNGWTHLFGAIPRGLFPQYATKTPDQYMAEKKEEFYLLQDAVNTIRLAHVDSAVNIMKSNTLYRSEKLLGHAEWFRFILADVNGSRYRKTKHNLLWLHTAKAPAGLCHVKNSAFGRLLELLQDNRSLSVVKEKFDAMMNPTKYRRPQAPPKAGNIASAEKIVTSLQAKGSFNRRYARFSELNLAWRPSAIPRAASSVRRGKQTQTGLFSHLHETRYDKSQYIRDLPEQTMSWHRFLTQVLPRVSKIQYYTSTYNSYGAIVTASRMSAPPIIMWDMDRLRNPFSWYVYTKPSAAINWNLRPNRLVDVTGICYQPSMWNSGFPQFGNGVFFLLSGCKEVGSSSGPGLGLFPEIMKSEFHPIRATIEAFSNEGVLANRTGATACGLLLSENQQTWDAKFKVSMGDIEQTIRLDRWM